MDNMNFETGSYNDNRWITTDLAAAKLSCTRGWIVRLIKRGKLEGKRVGRRLWVVDSGSVDTYDLARKRRR